MKRGSVIFDECGFLSDEMLNVYGAFAAVNKNFASGKDSSGHSIDPIRLRTFALALPNQKFYISSASDTDTEFYRLYRLFSKKQIMGDRNYCVIQVDCDVVLKPTIHGERVNSLLTKQDIDAEMRTNPEKCRREYYCQFTSDAGIKAIIKRASIVKNSETRPPLLYNDTNNKKFIIAYDPARSKDNSTIAVMELYFDEKDQIYKGRIVNCINLMDMGKKKKHPMQTPDQIEYLKELILQYNGDAPDYENIVAIYIDAGSGGGGVNIGDFLMPDWKDSTGKTHRGLIDKEYYEEYISKFPNAIDKLKLMSPTQFKSTMYEALIEMNDQDAISWTANFDNKNYLTMFETDDDKLQKERHNLTEKFKKEKVPENQISEMVEEELKKLSCIKTKIVKIDDYEKMALTNIDAMKEEVVNIVRKKRESGKDSFDLLPEKANKLNDDRAYCLCMLGYALSEKRREGIVNKKRIPPDKLSGFFDFKRPKVGNSIFD